MSYDWWARVDRMLCRVSGHAWIDGEYDWLGATRAVNACVRCGATSAAAAGRHRLARA